MSSRPLTRRNRSFEAQESASVPDIVPIAAGKGPEPIPLTESERIMWHGIQARHREVQRAADEAMRPVLADHTTFLALVADRLGLAAGAIGTTHQLEGDSVRSIPVTAENNP